MTDACPPPSALLQNVNHKILFQHAKGLLIEIDFSDIMAELTLASNSVGGHLDWYRPFQIYGGPARMLRGIVDLRKDVQTNPSPLTFSRQQFFPMQMMPEVEAVQKVIMERIGVEFNACLVNKYMLPEDHISPHADNESTVMAKFGVMSINAGVGSRVFEIQEQKGSGKWRFVTRPGFGLLMYGEDFQKTFFHAVLKIRIPPQLWTNLGMNPDCNARMERTSLTFRMHNEQIAKQDEKKRINNIAKKIKTEERNRMRGVEGCCTTVKKQKIYNKD